MLDSHHMPPLVEQDPLDPLERRALPNLPAWAQDPTARLYLSTTPTHTILLTNHPSFTMVSLYMSQTHAGGAIIHQTERRTVLALEYTDPDELGDEWYATAKHYAKWWMVGTGAKLIA